MFAHLRRSLLSTVSSLPPLRPLDWRRSKVRREHLIALGVPVNLDDVSSTPSLPYPCRRARADACSVRSLLRFLRSRRS